MVIDGVSLALIAASFASSLLVEQGVDAFPYGSIQRAVRGEHGGPFGLGFHGESFVSGGMGTGSRRRVTSS